MMKVNKGVSQRKNGKFEAYVMVTNAGGKSKQRFKAHVGTYNTEREARLAREAFIKKLI